MKKKHFLFILVGMFVLSVVSAIGYYALFTTTFNVNSAISLDGGETELGEVISGETYSGNDATISNIAPSEREIKVTDDSSENITTRYLSVINLVEKDVNFSENVWDVVEDGETVKVGYTVIADNFEAEVIEEDKKDGYELIYYADNVDRFDNTSKAISVNDVSENLPYEDDANADEYDYCETEEYATCHGAKLWYVPSDAINSDNTLDWSRADEFLYESKLIQYNSEGELTMYPETDLVLTPEYTIGDYVEGEQTITTTVA